jgi:hypothetical protein
MPSKPIWRDLAIATLREHGPMSKAELVELLGPNGARAASAIATARHENPGKFFRVTRYEVQRGRAGREIPIYAAGGGADAPRPAFGVDERKATQARYYRNNRARIIARVHARRRGPVSGNPWVALLEPSARRDVANSARMKERNRGYLLGSS